MIRLRKSPSNVKKRNNHVVHTEDHLVSLYNVTCQQLESLVISTHYFELSRPSQ